MRRIGIDVGGTFTDVVMVDDASGQVWSTKVSTTPADRVMGAMNGFRRILELSGTSPAQVGFIGHGTTMATNMIVEGKGAPTALITTTGFRDILELRRLSRHDRADLYDLQFRNPRPLVPRRWRFEVGERTRHDGSIETALDREQLTQVAKQIDASDIEAVAIVFLHAYANPAHEQRALEAVRRLLPDRFVTASHEVNPEMQEYERASSTVINAMLGPVCARYIERFGSQLKADGFGGELLFMQSNGGLASGDVVARKPIVLLESGPAGGVSAAVRGSDHLGIRGLLLGDMGGTTFDVSLVRDGRPELRTEAMVHTYAVRSPTIDIDSIGAGGGSIAWIDAGGGVRIGPQSAGADPGPACYGRGGERPTVTDCNLVLGYVDPDSFLGGEFRLDRAAAERAIETHLAKPLGVSTLEAARIVRAVSNSLMAQAMRLMTVERGFDPREFAYLCYGGAGPVHAVDLAEELDIRRVIVPPLPGLFSALGMVMADRLHDSQRAVEADLGSLAGERIEQLARELQREASDTFGVAVAALGVEARWRADCRYAGQPASIAVDIDASLIARASADPSAFRAELRTGFEQNHKRMWNFIKPDQPVILTNLRLQASVASGWRGAVRSRSEARGVPRERPVMIDGQPQVLRVLQRSWLTEGERIDGPAIIEEASSSIVFKAGQHAQVDAAGYLHIHL
ncbi:MAG: hydantoinase/oxoprolinase family protein [Burkholderiaceae bacterium]